MRSQKENCFTDFLLVRGHTFPQKKLLAKCECALQCIVMNLSQHSYFPAHKLLVVLFDITSCGTRLKHLECYQLVELDSLRDIRHVN